MNAQLVAAFGLVGLALATGSSLTAQAQGAAPGTFYRLIQNSRLTRTFTPTGADPQVRTSALKGTFRLVAQPSPEDWEWYRLTDVSLEAPELQALAPRLLGSGTYRRGGRGPLVQQLDVVLSLEDGPVTLSSGAVPLDEQWPRFDLTLRGGRTTAAGAEDYVLQWAAVPQLRSWHYTLLGSSYLLDDGFILGRPTIQLALRGGFELVLVSENPLFSRYHLFDLSFQAGWTGAEYSFTGEGEYEIGGEVAVLQRMTLDGWLKTPGQGSAMRFTNKTDWVGLQWPMLEVTVDQVGGTPLSSYSLHLLAAPLRDIWFSTAHGMTRGNVPWPDNHVSGGDVLSLDGRVIRSNAHLMARLGLMPGFGEYDVDALDIAPGGEVLFSLRDTVFSESLGSLDSGDVLSDRGRVAYRQGDLLSRFGLMPPIPDLGLDAVQVLDSGEVLFSLREGVFSEGLGRMLSPGDILSNQGRVWRTHDELLARFNPEDPEADYGLDAFYVWPHGEVWFSTQEGFRDRDGRGYLDGDLLSDQGFVVCRNLDLVRAFEPLEDLANFGLDGLFVVTDTSQPPADAGRPLLERDPATGALTLEWRHRGRVAQLERTTELGTPFVPLGPMVLDSVWNDPGMLLSGPQAYYRLRLW